MEISGCVNDLEKKFARERNFLKVSISRHGVSRLLWLNFLRPSDRYIDAARASILAASRLNRQNFPSTKSFVFVSRSSFACFISMSSVVQNKLRTIIFHLFFVNHWTDIRQWREIIANPVAFMAENSYYYDYWHAAIIDGSFNKSTIHLLVVKRYLTLKWLLEENSAPFLL